MSVPKLRFPDSLLFAEQKMTESKIESARKLLASGIARGDVAKDLAVSVPTLYMRLPASS
jgi:Helix-turn-helix domain of resolvase